ncbi:ubiquitin-like domain-containing CTD phosphatase 1 [Eupeodes corollae]|uniref:ubiquitin-like domain-containing CTD phosphatase 1 n=1 Tax=Eupeodes corollae TaxID=290404 RepID=UPI0024911D1C|nr:ubiquitin-like domain-containing CTD phosphatase 1 [Eupeodes corollae]
MTEIKDATIIVKWSGKEFPITDLTDQDTVAVLKHEIFKKTQVRPERQKLLNLKFKGKLAADNVKINCLELKPNFKVMMVGSTEADIEDACNRPEGMAEVIDDFDDPEEKEVSVENSAVFLAKIAKRIKDYKITVFNPPREGKRLLVLDIDYTLFDHRSSAETGAELMRPYLHEFLTSAYEDYDIVIWSATGMRWIEEKMKLLGVSSHTSYKIMFYLDLNAMITVHTAGRGVIDVKPLGVIWGNFPQYSSKNTIMFDDIRRNFIMNPKCGLKIRPFRQAHFNRQTDKELIKLAKYLKDIAENCCDFNKLNHRKWESYNARK